ncbi:flagellar hook-associated protein FlgK [Terasakiella sp. A23]|uniref:flagellar hook-associated protein FlgK n=1 Tax=Terasakiella sp. FCG-A23 TaxID=3080561 RepID=UPI002952C759|nr:flagellar hook-associated protein FlgK [Terasakiella sp. A23]MDV7339051.1 flagellar hook-associated protein FlgK [Terasakiella sp. A23]
MAGNITLALHTAKDGLLAMQSALGTVSENVANANTVGYSRKIVNLETRVVDGSGAGVQISEVQRTVDEGLMRDVREENAQLYQYEAKDSYYQRMEELFGSPADNTSISHTISELVASIETLSTTPDSSLNKAEVIRWALNTTDKLTDIASEIQDLRLQADVDLAQAANDANELIASIADMNDKIIRNQAVSNDVSDLKDRRDLALDELSQLVDIQYFERTNGEVAVFTRGGTVLVDSDAQTISHTRAAASGPTISHAQGGFTGILVGSYDITNDLLGGKMKGLVDLRDGSLNDFQRALDELSEEMKNVVNQAHNMGMAFPGHQTFEGQMYFADPADQTFELAANNDTRLVLFNSDGEQQATTTLSALFQDTTLGDTVNYSADGNNGTNIISITELNTRMEAWLDAEGAQATISFSQTTHGFVNITLSNSSLYLGFRDEVADTSAGQSVGDLGLTHQDASITFDATGANNGAGGYNQKTETFSGFSNFMGLNDFFVDGQVRDTYESAVVPTTTTTSATTLYIYDEDSGVGTGNDKHGGAGLTVQAGLTLEELATQINNDSTLNGLLEAVVVPEGSGERLRITHSSGKELILSEVAGGTLLSDLGMQESNIGLAQEISVRTTLQQTPGNIASQRIQFDSTLGIAGGEFYTAASDNSNAVGLADAFSNPNSFEAAGSFIVGSKSIVDYSIDIVSSSATLSANNQQDKETQEVLVNSLKNKSDTFKGVNLDEELAQLVLFEQAYAASARVISVINEMFDVLDRAAS